MWPSYVLLDPSQQGIKANSHEKKFAVSKIRIKICFIISADIITVIVMPATLSLSLIH